MKIGERGPRPPAIDAPANRRPGVPKEAVPAPDPGAHWDTPDRQRATTKIFARVGLTDLTPVFGTAQPPRWLSGRLRERAYSIPEHRASHWALLLIADRIDVAEHRIERLGGRPVSILALGAVVLAARAVLRSGSSR